MAVSTPIVEFLDGQRSDAGPRRTNEDGALNVRLTDGSVLAAVADGMGGLHAGDVASRTALDALKRSLDAGLGLPDAFAAANRAVRNRAGGREMGTTLVAAHVTGGEVRIAHVGDSRAYLVRASGCRQLTRDHTVLAEAAERGMDGNGLAGSPWARAVTRSLGAAETVDVDVLEPLRLDVVGSATLVLCSDGVHRVLDPDRIAEAVAAAKEPSAAADGLVGAALEGGSTDNATAVILTWRSPLDREDEEDRLALGGRIDRDDRDAPDDRADLDVESAWEMGAVGAVEDPHWDPGRMVSVSRRPDPRDSNWGMILLLGVVLLAVAVALLALLA